MVQAELEVDSQRWQVTCVSMGNPHALIYSNGDKRQIKVLLPSPCCACLAAQGLAALWQPAATQGARAIWTCFSVCAEPALCCS